MGISGNLREILRYMEGNISNFEGKFIALRWIFLVIFLQKFVKICQKFIFPGIVAFFQPWGTGISEYGCVSKHAPIFVHHFSFIICWNSAQKHLLFLTKESLF